LFQPWEEYREASSLGVTASFLGFGAAG
jgi:hypothetical protein